MSIYTKVRDWTNLKGTSLENALYRQWLIEKKEDAVSIIKSQPFY